MGNQTFNTTHYVNISMPRLSCMPQARIHFQKQSFLDFTSMPWLSCMPQARIHFQKTTFGVALALFGCPWDPFGPPWAPPFKPQAQCSPFAQPGDKIKPPGTHHGSHGSHGSRGSRGSGVKNCGSDPHPTRAGGQDDGSYTNSLKLIFSLYLLGSTAWAMPWKF